MLETRPRGKHILTRVEGGLTLHTHLRMDGMWHLHRPGARWTGGPDWQVRVVLSTSDWDAIGYRMPVLELLETEREGDVVGHLGPDLLDPAFDRDEAVRRLLTDPSREIGQALLDQSNLAGIGNMYKAEALFVGKVSPWTAGGRGGRPRRAGRRRAALLERNKAPRLAVDHRRPARHEHWVYGRAGKPCLRCGTRDRDGPAG